MKFLVNVTNNDISYSVNPSNFIEVAPTDYFIFSQGSAIVADGQPIPSEGDLNQALIIVPGIGDTLIPKLFLADISTNLLREIKLQSQNAQYVFCTSFTEETGDEPVLELWDNVSGNTITSQILGSGIAGNSNIKGIITTYSLPGVNWIGSPLAGASYRLLLNSGLGRILSPIDLYFNLKALINTSYITKLETPRLFLKFYITP